MVTRRETMTDMEYLSVLEDVWEGTGFQIVVVKEWFNLPWFV